MKFMFFCLSQLKYIFLPIFLTLLFLTGLQTVKAQTKVAKLTICEEIEGRKPGENTGTTLKAARPTTTFEFGGVDSVGVLLEFPAFNESKRIDIEAFRIDEGSEYKAFGDAVIVSRTDTKAYIIGRFSQLGKYVVKASCDDKVIAQETFSIVKGNNPQRGVISICKDIDNDLNPIEASTSFSIGSAVKFHVKFPRHNGQRFVFWTIFKLDNDGKDENFVDGFQMSVKNEWKTFATDEPYSLSEAGKYRIYVLDYDQGNSSNKSGNYEKYLAKTEITVK